jgi:ABC-type branched-subunit amino acid transport system substrate-binding protein
LLSDSEAPGDRYDRQLQEQAPRYGLKYLGGLAAPSTGDPKPLLQQLVQTGAQAVVVTGGPASAARIAGAIGQLGLGKQLQMLGLSGPAAYAFPQQAGDAAAGVVFEATNQSYLTELPQSRWAPPYRDFVRRITSQYGYASNGVEMLGLPAAADCVLSWSRAVRKANTFDGRPVVKAWETLDLAPRETVLAARERPSAGDHNLLRQDGIYVYEWMKNGDRWSLRQVAGPSA